MRHSETMDWRAAPSEVRDPGGEAGAVSIECHRRAIPGEIAGELDRLYGNLYSSIAQLSIVADLSEANAYVARRGGVPVAILIYRVTGRRAEVLNEVIRIETDEIVRFVRFVFGDDPSVGLVTFRAVQIGSNAIPFTHQRFNYLEDIVVALPDSAEAYTASLGKSTRRNTKRYLRALVDAHPDYEFSICEGSAIDEADLVAIVELNRARMAGKKKLSRIDQAEVERLSTLCKQCGLLGIARIGGRICAGAISTRIGDNYFLSVLAHDSAYNEYGLGMLCCYHTICACIERGGREFHFLWGQYDYKFQFLGVQRDLDNLAVYRSRMQYLLNSDFALQLVFNGYLRRAKTWLHGDTALSNLANKILGYVRNRSQGREKRNVYRYQVDRVGKRD